MSSPSSVNPYALVASLIVAAGFLAALISLYKGNRRLFACVIGALAFHGVIFSYLAYRSYLDSQNVPPPEIRIKIAAVRIESPPPPPPAPKPLATLPPEPLAVPQGITHPKPVVKEMPHGTTLKPITKSAPPPPKSSAPPPAGRVLSSPNSNSSIEVPADKASPLDNDNGDLDTNDLKTSDLASEHDTGIGTGTAGTAQGQGTGDIPSGFADGKVNGRVYFIRLKQGSGAWNAFSSGTNRLLAFINQTAFRAETETRALTAEEMRDKYMRFGSQPTFLYIYVDTSFHLTSSEVTILQDYMAKGGFLFLDSRPDPDILDVVRTQLDRILPGSNLSPISRRNSINSFLNRLDEPGVGENFVDQKNYGITQGGRLVVFYTPGNFAHFFSANRPEGDGYATAQYQMAANVIVYAIRKGDPSGVEQQPGAEAKVTTQALESLGELAEPAAAPASPQATPTSVKIIPTPVPGAKPQTGPATNPDDIKLLPDQ